MKRFLLFLMVVVLCIGCTSTTKEGFKIYDDVFLPVSIKDYTGTSKNIVIPETIHGRIVDEIWYAAFRNKGLENVTLPSGLKIIGMEAFNINNLTNVIIPNGVKRIEYSAFRNNKLTSITIPSSVLEIQDHAFKGNNISLPNVKIPDHLKPRMDAIFDPFPQLIVINQLTVPVMHLYLSPAGENKWEDILKEPILSGKGYGTDWIYRIRYDIRAVDNSGNTYTILNQDFSVTDGSVGKMFPITTSIKDK